MSTRPEALRLAEAIDPLTRYSLDNLTCSAAAAELRRLHEENQRLKDCLFQMQEAAKQLAVSQPAEWVGLTDDELELLNDCGDTDSYKFARAIEAKLKEKNT